MSEGRTPAHTYRRRIEFVDTDVSGNIHFSRFFVFMETAEHELLRALGTTVHLQDGERTIGWPRVDAQCQYLAPVRFGDELEIRVFIERLGTKSMTYAFEFHCHGTKVAEGRMSSVCCVLGDNGALQAIAIPESIAGKLAARVAETANSETETTVGAKP
jgi:YbgC/YbaW family acyl-CoA thioester hydrolase